MARHPARPVACQPLLCGATAGELAQSPREIVGQGGAELALGEVLANSEGGSTVFAIIEDVAEAPFEVFAALAQEGFAACASDCSLRLGKNLTDGGVLLDTEVTFVGGEAC